MNYVHFLSMRPADKYKAVLSLLEKILVDETNCVFIYFGPKFPDCFDKLIPHWLRFPALNKEINDHLCFLEDRIMHGIDNQENYQLVCLFDETSTNYHNDWRCFGYRFMFEDSHQRRRYGCATAIVCDSRGRELQSLWSHMTESRFVAYCGYHGEKSSILYQTQYWGGVLKIEFTLDQAQSELELMTDGKLLDKKLSNVTRMWFATCFKTGIVREKWETKTTWKHSNFFRCFGAYGWLFHRIRLFSQ